MSGKRSKAERKGRMQDLFLEGRVIRLHEDDDPLWVQKLNTFEQDEARRMAQAARARTLMALRREGGDEWTAITDSVAQMSRERMVTGIVGGLYTRHIGKASTDLYADPEWQERLDIMDHSIRETLPEDERAVLDEITTAYLAELQTRKAALDADETERLNTLPEDKLREEYIDTFIETRGTAVFMRDMRFAEVLFGVRMCDAESRDDGSWDHGSCSHDQFYDDLEEVRRLPDALMNRYTSTFDQINVAPSQGKDWGSRRASSAPSLPRSEEEASTPSTPEETSPELAGTSAQP